MSALVTGAEAMHTLPDLVHAEIARLDYMREAYELSKSASGFNQRDIARQVGYVQGLKGAFVHVLQEDWCSRNDHPVPMTGLSDADRYISEHPPTRGRAT